MRGPNLVPHASRYGTPDLASDDVLAEAATLLELVAIVRTRALQVQRNTEPVLAGRG